MMRDKDEKAFAKFVLPGFKIFAVFRYKVQVHECNTKHAAGAFLHSGHSMNIVPVE